MIRSQFLRHVVTMVSGSVFSQIISILAVPIVARLFNPADFGITAIFVTVISILASMAPLRYFRAALIEKDDDRAHILMVLSFRCLILSCMIVFVLTVLLKITGVQLPFGEAFNSWIWFVPVGMFIVGMSQIILHALMRLKKFKPLAVSDLVNAFLTASSRILFGLFGSSVLGLLAGYLIGAIGKLVILKVSAIRVTKNIKRRVEWSELKALAIEYKDFPLYNVPIALLSGMSRNLPIFLMGLMFEPVVIGFYAIADRLINRPLSVIGNPVREVFMVKAANTANDGKSIKTIFTKITLGLFVLGVIPFGVLMFFAEQFMDLLLGARWQGAGSYLEILAPWYFATWVVMGAQPAMVVIRRQELWLKVQIWMFAMRSAVFGVAYLVAADAKSTLIWFSSVNVLIGIAILCLTFYTLSRHKPSENV